MKRLVVTCEDGSRYEGALEDEQIQQPEIVDGVLTVTYRLASQPLGCALGGRRLMAVYPKCDRLTYGGMG